MPATVRWSRSIVWTRRRSSPCRISSANSSESGSGPRPSTGPTSPSPTTHQPALRSVPYSRTRSATSLSNRSRTTPPLPPRVVFGGCSTSSRPACERCTNTRGPPKSRIRYLPRRPVPTSVRPTSVSGGGSNVFRPENPMSCTSARAAPPTRSSSRSDNACIWGSSGTRSRYRVPITRPSSLPCSRRRLPRPSSSRDRCPSHDGRASSERRGLDPVPHFLPAVLGPEDVLDVLDVLGEQVRPGVPVLPGRALLPVRPERALDLVDVVVRHLCLLSPLRAPALRRRSAKPPPRGL